MKWNVGTKIGTGFGLVLVVFLIVGAVSYRSTTQLLAASDARKHTFELLSQINETFSLLQDVEIGQRSYGLVGEDAFLEPYRAALIKLHSSVQMLRQMTAANAQQQRRLDRVEPVIKSRLAFSKEAIDTRRTNGFEASLALVKTGRGKLYMDEIRDVFGEIENEEVASLKVRIEQAEAGGKLVKWSIVLGTFITMILSITAGIAISRNIARPLVEITGMAERMAAGDLTMKLVTNHRTDEIGLLAQSFARMSENLREQTRSMVESAGVLGAAASEIVASTSQLSSSATESATAVSETTTTVEEVRQTAQLASQKARVVSDSAQRSVQISQSGRKSTEDAAAGMNRIRQQMEAIAASMMRLSEQSQTIGEIITTVEDLSAQSNLLAVNAAIEAAKAGEHGKGFSVVAQEVKSLAEQSRLATSQVRNILSEIQKATTGAVMATEQGSKAVEAGEKQTGAAGDSIQLLAGSVSEAAQSATQIAASSQQQLVGMEQVAVAMENIKQASTQNVASAKQLETAARSLNELGQRLKQMVQGYKV